MNYKETKAMLEICQRNLSYHGCELAVKDLDTAMDSLDKEKNLIN
jgi:hypothetical protein|tara:strand:- start:5150 stop:5284 length:135 start_codon:yes stop_codon:yes gene_type:complete